MIHSDTDVKIIAISGKEVTSIEIKGRRKSFEDFCIFDNFNFMPKLKKVLIVGAAIDIGNHLHDCDVKGATEKEKTVEVIFKTFIYRVR